MALRDLNDRVPLSQSVTELAQASSSSSSAPVTTSASRVIDLTETENIPPLQPQPEVPRPRPIINNLSPPSPFSLATTQPASPASSSEDIVSFRIWDGAPRSFDEETLGSRYDADRLLESIRSEIREGDDEYRPALRIRGNTIAELSDSYLAAIVSCAQEKDCTPLFARRTTVQL